MKNINKLFLVSLYLIMALALAGCQSTNQSPTQTSAVTTTEKAISDDAAMTADKLTAAAKDDTIIVVDSRGTDSFIGFTIDGKGPGGHIVGATDFAAQWLTCDYDEDNNLEGFTRQKVLEDSMANKNIVPDSDVIIYDVDDDNAEAVANYFKSKGVQNVKTVNISDMSDLNMVSYPQYQRLMPPSLLDAIIKDKVPKFADKDIVIVDVGWGDNKQSGYMTGHIPTAIHINTDSFEPPVTNKDGATEWMLADDETLAQLLLANGITKDTVVISTGAEPMAASRFAVICEYLGVDEVYVLSGGLVNWNAQDYALEEGENSPTPATDFGAEYPVNKHLIITQDEAATMLKNGTGQLCDIREWAEHIGEKSGYSYHKKSGRIDGAIFAHAGENSSSSMYYYRNIDKTMRNADEILAMWTADGIDLKKPMAHMCGSGWRAAESMLYAMVAGLDNQSLYSDGWIGWSNNGRPSVTGEPTK